MKFKLNYLGWCTIGLFLLYTIFFFTGEFAGVKDWLAQYSLHLLTGLFFYGASRLDKNMF